MHVVPEEIGTQTAAMTIEHCKVAALWPLLQSLRFGYVQYYGHTVFVVVSDQSVKGVGRIALDVPVFFVHYSRFL